MPFSVDDKHLSKVFGEEKKITLRVSFLKNFRTRNGLVVV